MLELYTEDDLTQDKVICPNCGSGKMNRLSYTSTVDLKIARALADAKPVNKTRH